MDYTDYLIDKTESPLGARFTGWSPLPLMIRLTRWHYYVNSKSVCGKHTNHQRNGGSIIKPDDRECCQICLKKYNDHIKNRWRV